MSPRKSDEFINVKLFSLHWQVDYHGNRLLPVLVLACPP